MKSEMPLDGLLFIGSKLSAYQQQFLTTTASDSFGIHIDVVLV
jgi:hypothetical protein